MSNFETDESREHRITMEVIVDAYDEEEQRMGWYYYLEGKLNFPFKAKWLSTGRKSSSTQGEEVEVVGMPPEDDCTKEMFVEVLYTEGTVEDTFSVPLSKIEAVDADDATEEAIADWNYWVNSGYQF